MVDKRISELDSIAGGDVDDALDILQIVDTSETTNRKITVSEFREALNVEDGADVTDTANVTAAGALMDSEVDADIKTLSLPANTTISAFGASLVDDADAATGRATLGLLTYVSTGQTITSGGTLTLTHGLGAEPIFPPDYYLVCTTADAGWSVGNKVTPSKDALRGVTFNWDATSIEVVFSNSGSAFIAFNKSTGSPTALTNGSWEFYVVARIN